MKNYCHLSSMMESFYLGSLVFCRRLLLLGLAWSVLSQGAQAATESRLALLIGNSVYKNSPLANPVNDVRLMEAALKESGFTVIKAENASIREMRRLVRNFGDKLKATGGVGLFYFAGHGVQVRGENFLVSTDSDIRNEDEVADDSINANVVLEKMQSAGNRVNLVILDACRNNPFGVRSRNTASGLANMNAPSGSLVAYSTAPGAVASDGNGNNGLYTEHLAKVIRQPGLPVEEVFKQVRAAVRRDSKNQQTPWENTALEGQFYFRAPPQMALPAPAPDPTPAPLAATQSGSEPFNMEMALWDSVKTATTLAELRAYLNRYPNGFFAEVAKARIAALDSSASEKFTAERVAAYSEQKVATEQVKTEASQKFAAEQTKVEAAQRARVPVQVPVAELPTTSNLRVGDMVGSLVMKNTMTGIKSSVDVTVLRTNAQETAYSTGDVIAKDGRVLQAKIGDYVMRFETGALWTFPLKVGMTGSAKIRMMMPNDDFSGAMDWKTVAGADGKIQVLADVSHFAPSANAGGPIWTSGTWSGTYSRHVLPESFLTSIRSRAGLYSNMVSAELNLR